MNFTIAGVPMGGNLSMCQRLEFLDMHAMFAIIMYTMAAILIFTIASPWIFPSIYRGDCGCIPGMVCDVCIAGDESEQDENESEERRE